MKAPSAKTNAPGLGLMALLLVVVLGFLLGQGCLPGRILFSNDGPLGRLMEDCHRLPDRFFGCWHDLNSIGYREESAVPSVSYALLGGLGPLWFAKLYTPVALLLLGLSAWCLFRQMGLAPAACLLGGMAASLNSVYFSSACWGMGAHPIMVGMVCLALAALAKTDSPLRWWRVALAGFAVGMGVVEGADVGAIFSLLVATFVIYQACVIEARSWRNFGLGSTRAVIVAVCAAAVAASAIGELLVTNVENVVAAGAQETRTAAGHWDWATQWSLPKVEALGLVVPGLFGWRTDTSEGGNYWGATGRHAAWDRYFASGRKGAQPTGLLRYVGGGNYAGVAVALVAVWAAVQSFRRKDPIFDLSRRKLIWFWLGVTVLSLLFAFGRFAPFYRLVYILPYFKTIRNPVKFLHVFSLGLVVLFALGVDGLWKAYLRPALANGAARPLSFAAWWAKAPRIDKLWVQGCLGVLGLSLLGWASYALARQSLEDYLGTVNYSPYLAGRIADYSIDQPGWFVLFFVLAAGLLTLMLSGRFGGPRARAGMVLLGLLLVVDLGRANLPWIKSWDFNEKYATNPLIERLRVKPYESRISNLPRDFLSPGFKQAFHESDKLASSEAVMFKLYDFEWVQHLFNYYNIQSLNLVQLPRKPADLKAFEEAFTPQGPRDYPRLLPRYWQLTNTRYLVGDKGFLAFLNGLVDPVEHRFSIAEAFNLRPKGGRATPKDWADLEVVPAANGDYALFEFAGALPRVRLYSNWLVNTNEQETVRMLTDPAFKPEQTVLVSSPLPGGEAPGAGGQPGGAVEVVKYSPKDIVLKATATAPSVLLENSRFDPAWRVWVDGQSNTVLHCNYTMRGVFLNPGSHTIEFRFQPPHGGLYVSLAAVFAALALAGYVAWAGRPPGETPAEQAGVRPGRSRDAAAKPAAKAREATPAALRPGGGEKPRKSDRREAVKTPAAK